MADPHQSRRSIRGGRLRIRVITPAIIGGPDGRAGDAISPMRVPSLRGVWRWWFRASLGAVLRPSGNTKHAEDAMLEAMRSMEARLFGATDQASMLVMRPAQLVAGAGRRKLSDPGRRQKGQSYLAYGLFDRHQDTYAIEPGSEYDLRFRLRPDPGGEDQLILDAFRAAIWAWTTFGGLGARSRRGWGSVELVEAELNGAPWAWRGADLSRPEGINGLLNGTVKGLGQVFADFSALCRAAKLTPNQGTPLVEMRTLAGLKRVVPLSPHADAMEALEQAGSIFQRFRSTVERSKAGLRPLPDYFEVKAAIERKPGAPRHVDRAAFGLPLPFYFRSLGGQKTRFVPMTRGADRLASPLQIRVRPIAVRGQTRYVPVYADLSERGEADPLLGQGVKMHNRSASVPTPDGRLISTFLDWAPTQTSQPQRGRRR